IIRHLVDTANLSAALKAWEDEPVKPGLGLWLDELNLDSPPRDRQGFLVVQPGRSLTLRAALFGVPLSKVRKVQWQFDGGPRRDFDADLEYQLTADLLKVDWKRGLHELRLIVTTADRKEHTESLRVHSLPPRPAVAFDRDWLKATFKGQPLDRLEVSKPDLVVK